MTVLQELKKGDHFLADKHACVLVTVVNVAMGLSGDDLVYKIIKIIVIVAKFLFVK
jgi:hypothetical protein